MFHNILDRKKPFLAIKISFLLSPKSHIFFAKGLTDGFVQKCHFFLYLLLVKTRLEKMFHSILDKKETFFGDKNIIPLKSQKSHFLQRS